MGALLVVNMRGTLNIPHPIKRTLRQLHLSTRFRATVLPDNPITKGMLQKVKNYVAWSDADLDVVTRLLEVRGMKSARARLALKDMQLQGFTTLRDLGKAIVKGEVTISKLASIKPSFTLSPPRGGFKRSTRRMYSQGGILGKNPDLAKLVEIML